MNLPAGDDAGRTRWGIILIVLSFAFFALHDALFKLLAADFSVFQILFVRSLLVLAVCAAVIHAGRRPSGLSTPLMPRIIGRSIILFLGWILYYTAARDLPLAEVTTLYYAAPVMVALFSAMFLRERVSGGTWVALLVGLIGVLIASGVVTLSLTFASVLALSAAFLWAMSTVLLRQLSLTQSTTAQMVVSNLVFALFTLPVIVVSWRSPALLQWLGLFAVGALGGLAQLLLIESLRRAPASTIAPFEYTALIWAFLLQFLIWGDLPSNHAMIGAGLIVGSAVIGFLARPISRDPGIPQDRQSCRTEGEKQET